jgi:FG-GAP repeat
LLHIQSTRAFSIAPIIFSLMLTACGGGGGGGSAPPPTSSSSSSSALSSSSASSSSSSASSSSSSSSSSVASSSSSSSASSSSSTSSLPAPSLTLTYDPNRVFDFRWGGTGFSTLQLMEKIDGASSFVQIGPSNMLPNVGYLYPVPLFKRVNAQYKLVACQTVSNCVDSNIVTVTDTMAASVGYLKPGKNALITITGDNFGTAVALAADGKTLAVGAPGDDSDAVGVDNDQDNDRAIDSGAVYVYKLDVTGIWSSIGYIKPPAAMTGVTAGIAFGSAIALSADGNTLVVGAPEYQNGTGIAYVYSRSNDLWSYQTTLQISGLRTGDSFGRAMSFSSDGNTLAVSAPMADATVSGDDCGAVYLFTRTDTTWSTPVTLRADNAGASDFFGLALALSNDGQTLVVGAPYEDGVSNAKPDSGAVYVFQKNSGTWAQSDYLHSTQPDNDDHFGTSVAIDATGAVIAIGAPNEDSNATGANGVASNNSTFDSGAVYIFNKSVTNYQQAAYLKPLKAAVGLGFGNSVGLNADGTQLAIGQYLSEDKNPDGVTATPPADSYGTNQDGSAIYFLQRAANDVVNWTYKSYMQENNNTHVGGGSGVGGVNVALSGDGNTLVLGEKFDDTIAGDAGAVYTY